MKMRNCLYVRVLCEFSPARSSQIHAAQAGRRVLPNERIAQHLSEWAQTAAGIHDQKSASDPAAASAGSGQ